MSSHFRDINDVIARSLDLESEGKGKLLPLEEAIERYIKPGMTLHLACGLSGPSAAICEIIRQYWSKNPGFVLVQTVLAGHVTNLIHARMVKKLIFSVSAGPGKSRKEIQKAFNEKSIEFENWSLLSLQQRLMAGALGLSFMPTRSIIGSSMALDNAESFKEINDPFGTETSVGIVKALYPDISIVHGCVADVHGNTILSAPYGDDIWGPLASTNGAIVTVEKIVPTAFLRKYPALVKLPGYVVKAVCTAPFGVHPFSLSNPGISEFDAYGGDSEFMESLHTAAEDSSALDVWITEWVLDCPTHEHYLKKLGARKLNALRGMTSRNVLDYYYSFPSPPDNQDYTPEEVTPIIAAREIIKSIRISQHKTILAGAGAGLVASWLAYYQLKAEGYEIELIQGNGQIGYLPQPSDSLLRKGATAPSAKMLSDALITHGVLVGGKHNQCISLLGAGEIDKYGNINSTKTSTGMFLSGSGGANDAANAREVIIVIDQSSRRFVEKLPFITCPGNNVTKVISTMGVLEKSSGRAELYLTACFPGMEPTNLEERIAQVQANCGWTLKLADKIEDIPAPSLSELQLLRSLLPASLA